MELRLFTKDLISNQLQKKYKISDMDWDGTDLIIHSEIPVPEQVKTKLKQELGLEMQYMFNKDPALSGDESLECFFQAAFEKRATDIHFEPLDKAVRVRLRIDGYLQSVDTLSFTEYARMLRVIKIQGGMDIAENRLPQEGGFRHENRRHDIRISILPSLYGEKAVLRILPLENNLQELSKLGMSSHQIDIVLQALSKKSGSIIINGPTGSGKSTTLHAILHEINCEENSVLSIEDPIEIINPFITQFQVNEPLGLTYAEYLRRSLRQDPDVILLGEIRDSATARLACEASLTGHFVLSTIHTKTTLDVIYRLLEMQLEPFLIADAVQLLINQRLVRKNCPYCSEEESLPQSMSALFKTSTQRKGKGCEKCNLTGYLGRVGLFELNEITPETKKVILRYRSSSKMDSYPSIINKGIQSPLLQQAIRLIEKGDVCYQEVIPCL